MNGYKVWLNYLLWFLKIRRILPKEIIDRVIIKENNEPLVDLGDGFTARKSVKELLEKAQNNLPDGYKIKVVSAYRDLGTQKKNWETELNIIKKEFPNLQEEEQIRKARMFSAEPNGSGPHQTGGAVDVVLLDKNGNKVPMGTEYAEHSPKAATFAEFCTAEEKQNRKILLNAMEGAGFKNYPGEWWHFSYGDKLWAAYSRKKECFYGKIYK